MEKYNRRFLVGSLSVWRSVGSLQIQLISTSHDEYADIKKLL